MVFCFKFFSFVWVKTKLNKKKNPDEKQITDVDNECSLARLFVRIRIECYELNLNESVLNRVHDELNIVVYMFIWTCCKWIMCSTNAAANSQ